MLQSITNFQTAEKVMPYHISPNGSAGGCFPAYYKEATNNGFEVFKNMGDLIEFISQN